MASIACGAVCRSSTGAASASCGGSPVRPGRPHDTGPGPTSWALVWAPYAPVSSWVIGSDHCQPGWSCNWHWMAVSPGGGHGKSPRSNVSPRRGSLGEMPGTSVSPRRGSLGETPRSNVSPRRGSLGEMLRISVSPRRGCLGEIASEQRFPQEGVSRGNAAERYPSPARGGPGGAGKCAEAQFVSGEARSAGGDTILRRPDKG